ncbi:TVP38/TMEM64 family protein [Actinospongicola halichondriae]|uniref:TVP38/TMEM64 family protein n=1 Tax=Actinospongicola halichondriae TaxID=3236844 RepID=UPI003D38C714
MTIADPVPALGAPRRNRRRRLLLIGLAITVFVVARRSGLTDVLGDEERLKDLVDSAGWLGPFLYTVLFTLLVPVGVPGLVFVLPAAVVFPAPVAIAVCLVAGYLSSGAGVWFARTVGRQTVEAKMPASFRKWDERIARRGLLAVLALRTLTYLAAPADWLLGLSSIPTRTIVIGTGVGLIPPTVLYVVAGGGVLDLIL